MMLIPHICSVDRSANHQYSALEDIDSARREILTSNHDRSRGDSSTAKARDDENGAEATEERALADDLLLDLKLGVNRIHVPGCLHVGVAKASEGLPGLRVATLLHEPAGRLGNEVHADLWMRM